MVSGSTTAQVFCLTFDLFFLMCPSWCLHKHPILGGDLDRNLQPELERGCSHSLLVGGLELVFSIYIYIWEFLTPIWRTHIFQRGRLKPPTSYSFCELNTSWERSFSSDDAWHHSQIPQLLEAPSHIGLSETGYLNGRKLMSWIARPCIRFWNVLLIDIIYYDILIYIYIYTYIYNNWYHI